MNERHALNQRIADRLRADGAIDETGYVMAVEHAKSHGWRVEEALIELSIIDEASLLKFIATLFRTQFVSTEKLSRAKLDAEALKLVNKQTARHLGAFPVVLDRKNDKLIVATADPDNPHAEHELCLAAQVSQVAFLVARPAAVAAAIARAYDREHGEFKRLLMSAKAVRIDANQLLHDPFAQGSAAKGAAPAPAPPRREEGTGTAGQHMPAPRGPQPRTGGIPRRVSGGEAGRTEEEPQRPAYLSSPRPEMRGALGVGMSPLPAQPSPQPGGGRFAPSPAPPGQVPLAHPSASRQRHTPWIDPRALEPMGPMASIARSAPRSPEPVGRSPFPSPEPPTPPSLGAEPPPAASSSGVAHHIAPPRNSLEALFDVGGILDSVDTLRPDPRPSSSRSFAPLDFPLELPQLPQLPRSMRSSSMRPDARFGWPSVPVVQRSSHPAPAEVPAVSAQLADLARVLVGMLEHEHAEHRGHSTACARLVSAVCERIGLPKSHTSEIVLAAYLHDFGKMGGSHLTLLNSSQFPTHHERANTLAAIPRQLLEGIGLPERTLGALDAMYEQVDGGGVPDGLQGKEIPIAARILSLADTYADLTRNPENPHAKVLSQKEAIEVLRDHSGTVFDANLVEVFDKATGGEEILSELLADRHRVLVVDPNLEETVVLQLRMVEQGFDVHVAHGSLDAKREMEAHDFSAILCEIELEHRDAGFALRELAARIEPSASWVFLSSRGSRTTAQRVFDMDVDDLLIKPVSHDVVAAKLKQLIERRAHRITARGVAGDLSQMGFPEIVQVLGHGRKTCALHIASGECRGEVHFRQGRVVHAAFGDIVGPDAFYRMVALRDEGGFRVDPTGFDFTPTIDASPEALLLEGARRLDEELR